MGDLGVPWSLPDRAGRWSYLAPANADGNSRDATCIAGLTAPMPFSRQRGWRMAKGQSGFSVLAGCVQRRPRASVLISKEPPTGFRFSGCVRLCPPRLLSGLLSATLSSGVLGRTGRHNGCWVVAFVWDRPREALRPRSARTRGLSPVSWSSVDQVIGQGRAGAGPGQAEHGGKVFWSRPRWGQHRR